jgi:hypothetical protein
MEDRLLCCQFGGAAVFQRAKLACLQRFELPRQAIELWWRRPNVNGLGMVFEAE